MIKTSLLSLMLVLVFSSISFAQSDYQLTQSFRNKLKHFDETIDTVSNLSSLNHIKNKVEIFKSDYVHKKDLLDKALFPNDFNKSFSTLYKKIDNAAQSLSKINTLSNEVSETKKEVLKLTNEMQILSTRIYKLNEEKKDLFREIIRLNEQPEKDKLTIDSLMFLSNSLKNKILQRDNLIFEIIDSIFITNSSTSTTMNDAENKEFKQAVESYDLLENFKNLVTDNISFIQASQLTAQDFIEIKNEYLEFRERWQILGPQLTQVYSEESTAKDNLTELNSFLDNWGYTIDNNIWVNIKREFENAGVSLEYFYSADEFKQAITIFVEKEISLIDKEESDDPYDMYDKFVNTYWQEKFVPEWLPVLRDYNYITQPNVQAIKDRLNIWEAKVNKPFPLWMYILIGLVFLSITLIYINMAAKKNKNKDLL